ncbi:MAG: PLP-dependent transferase, partial [Bacteroidota bacterium]|nr:PLP-dependent transferase [Bacteroidota bacterium]
ETIYGGSYAFFKNYLPKFNIDVTFVNITDLEQVKAAVKSNTKLIYSETMTNPLLQISDVAKLADITKSAGIKLVIDNTFTPMIFRPKAFGADIVIYSMTKYINGKNDCVAGAICGNIDFINDLSSVIDGTAMLLGPVLDPMRSSSILKNLHTLHIRMKQHSKNAMYLAERFKEFGLKYIYPGMPEHQGYKLMKSMMNEEFGFGGMIAIDMETSERANLLMEKMQAKGVGYIAVSLGYFKTIFSNSGKSTSSEVPAETQLSTGMSPGLVRFSVGLDNDIENTWQLIKSCIDGV